MTSFFNLLSVISKTGHQLYLFIDEYDNFANEMIANRQDEKYFSMTGLGGFMKTLFKQLKSATEGLGLDRMYLTGVTLNNFLIFSFYNCYKYVEKMGLNKYHRLSFYLQLF